MNYIDSTSLQPGSSLAILLPAVMGLIGALVGAGIAGVVALKVQKASSKAARDLEEMKLNRHDEGVRRQIRALMKDLDRYCFVAQSQGLINDAMWAVSLERVENRVSMPDVADALDEAQAAAVFEATYLNSMNLQTIARLNRFFESLKTPDQAARETHQNSVSGAATPARDAMLRVWETFGMKSPTPIQPGVS
ncbi:MAG TPA: hypothetical protein VN934_05840 [Candidatus Tumulicola sp.]|nr:hypothetical protein [Candidatus Tumulicola sp.]